MDQVALCACGSGLSAIRCCAWTEAARMPAGLSQDTEAMIACAVQAHTSGGTQLAERLSLDLLEMIPTQRDALRVLYEVRKSSRPPSAAEALLRRLVALDPNDFWATHALALLLMNSARMNNASLAEAELHARNAIRLAPENAQAHHLMGMILTEAHKAHFGEYHYRRALELAERRDPILLANLAWNLKNQGKMEQARQLYIESTELAADVPQTLLGWARMEEADRQFDRAGEILDAAEKAFPNNPSMLLARAVLLRRMGCDEQALAVFEQIAGLSPAGVPGPDELLEKGALLDRLGRYDEAFSAIDDAKCTARAALGHDYLAEHAEELATRLKRFFIADRLRSLPRAGILDGAPKPIFVLGFPRSGTTLVEQMLSAHPRISAGDELPFIEEITGAMPRMFSSPLAYPEALAELWMADHRDGLDVLRDHYLRRLRQLDVVGGEAAWFTDKMPLNETHLGLIALMFPRAPLIHVLRHPLDVVLSVFGNNLTHGFFCAYRLETAARHYALTMDLVEHYRREMALRYLPVRYEDIVDDPESSVRRMLDFIGEPFDEGCLHFHQNRRFARTASYAQVTEKLYARSRFRYRHYLPQLEPAVPILRPIIERLGYGPI